MNLIRRIGNGLGFNTKAARAFAVGFTTCFSVVLALCYQASAQALITPPDIGVDGQEVADAVGTELSQYIYPLLGLAIAFMGLRFVWRKMFAGGK